MSANKDDDEERKLSVSTQMHLSRRWEERTMEEKERVSSRKSTVETVPR